MRRSLWRQLRWESTCFVRSRWRTACMRPARCAMLLIGKVKEVHSWQAGAMDWLRTATRPKDSDPVPPSLNWDVWLGVAPVRQFKKGLYHPWNWRAWQDFSTGQLGDFACHILDPVFMALELTSPTTIEADAPPLNKDTWARKSTVKYTFPGTKRT